MSRGINTASENGILGISGTFRQLFTEAATWESAPLCRHNHIQKGILRCALRGSCCVSFRLVHAFRGICLAEFLNGSTRLVIHADMEYRILCSTIVLGWLFYSGKNQQEE